VLIKSGVFVYAKKQLNTSSRLWNNWTLLMIQSKVLRMKILLN